MMRLGYVAGAVALALSTGAWAETSLMDVYRQAVDKDPELAVQRLNQDNAAAQVKDGLSNLLPSVDARAGWDISNSCNALGTDYQLTPDFENCQSASAAVSVSQNLFALAAVDAYEALQLNASRVEIETESAMQDLMVRVAEAYVSVLRAQDARDSVEAQLAAVERQYEQTQQRHEVGLVTVTDVMDAQATLDETRVALIQARNQYDIALQNLSVLTGGEAPEAVMTLGDSLPIQMPAEGGMQEWIDYALENHPDILAARKGLESGEKELQARRSNRLPVVSASASVNYGDDPSDGLDFDERLGSSIGLSVSVPLYTGGATEAQIVTAGIQNNIAAEQLELLRRNISVQVGNLYRQVRTDVQNIEAQRQVVASRESALEATRVGYEAGTRNIVEVLSAQQALFQARQAFSGARYDYVIDRLQLKQAAGQLRADDLNSLEAFLVQP